MSRKSSSRSKRPSARTDLKNTLEQGNRLLQNKKYKKALALCERFLASEPDNPYVLSLAGIASDLNQQPSNAIDYFRNAIASAPNDASLYYNLGKSLKQAGNILEAITAYQQALELAPENQAILLNLGNLYLGEEQADAAIPLFQKLLHINPGHVKAIRGLGTALRLDGQFDNARDCFLKAHELVPEDSQVLIDLAYSHYLLGEPGQAEPIFREAIRLQPDNAQAYHGLGTALNSMGRTAEAIDCLRTAIRLDPTHARSHQQLAFLIKHKTYDNDIREMEKLLKQPALDTAQKSSLNFGLGKAFEDLREYDKAFQHYAAANDLKRNTAKYNIAGERETIENIIRTFDAKLFERFGNCGHSSNNPIFIIGMPRSGTTLIEQILSSHPDVHGAGEIKYLSDIVRNHFNKHLHAQFPDGIEHLGCETLREIGEQYLARTSRHDSSARHITNKMPYNFLYVGMIRLILPNATIIHCTRNPLDTCFSCYANNFAEKQLYTNSLDELGQYYALYYKLMQHWQQLDISNIIEITYEDLVNNQESQTRHLLDACGLEWNDACLNFHKSDRPVITASVNQVRSGMYNKSVQRWKHFENHLTPLIDSLSKVISSQNNAE